MSSKEKQVAYLYKKKQIESASPGQLVLLLFDAAIDHLNRAEAGLALPSYKRIEEYHKNIVVCQNILTELMVSLDLEKGQELANNLYRLYEYMHHRLITSNVHKGTETIAEVKKLLSNLKEAWTETVNREIKAARVQPMQKSCLNLKG